MTTSRDASATGDGRPVGAIAVELRRVLEGTYDASGKPQPGDLYARLAEIGIRKNRPPKPLDELSHLSPDDRAARKVVEAFLTSRSEAGVARDAAIGEFLRKAAYGWANRLIALRCMEARGLIDEVIIGSHRRRPNGARVKTMACSRSLSTSWSEGQHGFPCFWIHAP
jgi:hypothetical protein